MSTKSYVSVVGTIFLIIAVMHLWRAFSGWEMTVGGWSAPVWASWVGFIIAGYLAYQGLKKR